MLARVGAREPRDEAEARGTGIWCNARTTAVRFYARSGFRRTGEEFDMPAIGPHDTLVWPGPRG